MLKVRLKVKNAFSKQIPIWALDADNKDQMQQGLQALFFISLSHFDQVKVTYLWNDHLTVLLDETIHMLVYGLELIVVLVPFGVIFGGRCHGQIFYFRKSLSQKMTISELVDLVNFCISDGLEPMKES